MQAERQKMIFLNKLVKILKQPLPLNLSIVNIIIASVTFGAFVFFFLIIFKPFGLQVLSGKALITVTSGYGFVTTGYLTIHSLIIVVILTEKNWTVGKEILNTLIIIAMIGLCNYLYHSIYSSQKLILVVHPFPFLAAYKETLEHPRLLHRKVCDHL